VDISPVRSNKYLRSVYLNRNIAMNTVIMGLSKTEIFTAQQNELASLAKALGHPARIAILEYLIRQNACVCGDIVDEIGLAQATISQHLKALKSVGLIKGEIDGTAVCYCIDTDQWSRIRAYFEHFLQRMDSHASGQCC
jgi:ArsR family transcriptional regulator